MARNTSGRLRPTIRRFGRPPRHVAAWKRGCRGARRVERPPRRAASPRPLSQGPPKIKPMNCCCFFAECLPPGDKCEFTCDCDLPVCCAPCAPCQAACCPGGACNCPGCCKGGECICPGAACCKCAAGTCASCCSGGGCCYEGAGLGGTQPFDVASMCFSTTRRRRFLDGRRVWACSSRLVQERAKSVEIWSRFEYLRRAYSVVDFRTGMNCACSLLCCIPILCCKIKECCTGCGPYKCCVKPCVSCVYQKCCDGVCKPCFVVCCPCCLGLDSMMTGYGFTWCCCHVTCLMPCSKQKEALQMPVPPAKKAGFTTNLGLPGGAAPAADAMER